MEDFRKIIVEIEMKIQKMRISLQNVQADNETLKAEIATLTNKLGQREQEANDFKEKYDKIKDQLEQRVEVQEKQDDKSAQIDALVWEIDDCISRLKAE